MHEFRIRRVTMAAEPNRRLLHLALEIMAQHEAAASKKPWEWQSLVSSALEEAQEQLVPLEPVNCETTLAVQWPGQCLERVRVR